MAQPREGGGGGKGMELCRLIGSVQIQAEEGATRHGPGAQLSTLYPQDGYTELHVHHCKTPSKKRRAGQRVSRTHAQTNFWESKTQNKVNRCWKPWM